MKKIIKFSFILLILIVMFFTIYTVANKGGFSLTKVIDKDNNTTETDNNKSTLVYKRDEYNTIPLITLSDEEKQEALKSLQEDEEFKTYDFLRNTGKYFAYNPNEHFKDYELDLENTSPKEFVDLFYDSLFAKIEQAKAEGVNFLIVSKNYTYGYIHGVGEFHSTTNFNCWAGDSDNIYKSDNGVSEIAIGNKYLVRLTGIDLPSTKVYISRNDLIKVPMGVRVEEARYVRLPQTPSKHMFIVKNPSVSYSDYKNGGQYGFIPDGAMLLGSYTDNKYKASYHKFISSRKVVEFKGQKSWGTVEMPKRYECDFGIVKDGSSLALESDGCDTNFNNYWSCGDFIAYFGNLANIKMYVPERINEGAPYHAKHFFGMFDNVGKVFSNNFAIYVDDFETDHSALVLDQCIPYARYSVNVCEQMIEDGFITDDTLISYNPYNKEYYSYFDSSYSCKIGKETEIYSEYIDISNSVCAAFSNFEFDVDSESLFERWNQPLSLEEYNSIRRATHWNV
jgi:hypothetical protein